MNKLNPSTSSKRRLKIATKYAACEARPLAVFPEIRLKGKWLQDLGFACGKMVSIQLQENQLIITLEQ
jgi:toxic protein SymE